MENEQQPNEQTMSKKPETSKLKTDQAEEKMFQLADLSRLTFKKNDGQEGDVWASTADEFQAFIHRFGKVDNVDISVWPVFDRLDYVNELWQFCQQRRYRFPFTVKPVEQPVEMSEGTQETKKA